MTGLAGANCRHTMTPYVPGLSKLPRTDFSAEEKLFGKTSDEYYEATQVQRRLERQVRKYKRRIACGEERGLDMTGDRARLGQAQKRVRQWCKQNKLPRQLERERAYGVAKQPRALGPKMLRVAEPLVSKGKRGAFSVNTKVVNSSGYERRIGSLPVPKRGAQGIRREAGRILEHCNGTQHERISVIAWKDGKPIADTFGADPKDGAAQIPLDLFKDTKGGVIVIHNHPGNGRPSFTDIESVATNDFIKGSFVACHDGSGFFIQSGDPGVVKAYDEIKNALKDLNPGRTGIEIDRMALDVLYKKNKSEKWFRIIKI